MKSAKQLNLKYPNNMFYDAYNRNSLFKTHYTEFTMLDTNLKKAFVYAMSNNSVFSEKEITILSQIYNENVLGQTVAKMLHISYTRITHIKLNALDKLYSIMLIIDAYKEDGVEIIKLIISKDYDSSNAKTRKLLRYMPIYYLEGLVSTRLYNKFVDNDIICLDEFRFTSHDLIPIVYGIGHGSMNELDELARISDLIFIDEEEAIS